MTKRKLPQHKKTPGRKEGSTKVTDAQRTTILAMLREDATHEEACAEAGISTKTMQREMKRRPTFMSLVSQAKSFGYRVARQSVIRHMEKDGHLAMKFLQARDKRYKPKLSQTFTDEDRAEQMRKIEEAGLGVPENLDVDEGFLPLSRKQ